MSIDNKTINNIAKLARISLSEEEASRYSRELNGIFGWIEQLNEVNTEGIPPMSGVGDYTLRMREDIVTDGDIQNDVLSNAPEKGFGCYFVPKVIE